MAKRESINVVDQAGVRAVVIKTTHPISASTLDEPRATVDGIPEFHLGDGTPLNATPDGWEIPGGSRRFRRA